MKSTETYNFDLWAEYLSLQIARQAASHLSKDTNRLLTVKIFLDPYNLWPQFYKLQLATGMFVANKAPNQHQPNRLLVEPNLFPIDYQAPIASALTTNPEGDDPVKRRFIDAAKQQEENFYSDFWSLTDYFGLPATLAKLALLSLCKLMPKALQRQGIALADNYKTRLFDNKKDELLIYQSTHIHELKHFLNMYLPNPALLELFADHCFAHEENKRWLKSLLNSE